MSIKVMAVNAGSSSLKFKLYDMPSETVICKGIADRIGHEDAIFRIESKNGKKEYLSRLLNCFHKFMKEHGYNTQVDGFHTVFANCTEFNSLEECYANFKCCVNGYINS